MNKYKFVKFTEIEIISISNETILFKEHCHSDCFVVTTIIDGNVILIKDNKTIHLSKGEIFHISPYVNHSVKSENKASILSICVKKQTMDLNQEEYDLIINSCLDHIIQSEEITSEIKTELQILYEIFHTRQYDKKFFGIEMIEKSPEMNISLEQLSANSYTSKYHYIRSFRKAAGLTPHNFIILRRVRKAQRLLDNGSSVVSAAISSGFYDQSHFDKYFKRIVGISPAEYSHSVITENK